MKKFVTKLIIFLGLGFCILNFIIAPYLLDIISRGNERLGFPLRVLKNLLEVKDESKFQVIEGSKIPTDSEVLIIGDSVARQLFPFNIFEQYKYLHLPSTAAITLAGQYIMIQNVLKNSPKIKKIILIMHPYSCRTNLNSKYTYNYFIKHFYTFENLKYLNKTVISRINQHPLCHLGIFPAVKITKLFSNVIYSGASRKEKTYFSKISLEYLQEMKKLAQKESLVFLVVCPPLSAAIFPNKDFSTMMSQIEHHKLQDIFIHYFEKMIFLNKSYFLDGVHFSKQSVSIVKKKFKKFLEYVLNGQNPKKIMNLFKNTHDILSYFKLEDDLEFILKLEKINATRFLENFLPGKDLSINDILKINIDFDFSKIEDILKEKQPSLIIFDSSLHIENTAKLANSISSIINFNENSFTYAFIKNLDNQKIFKKEKELYPETFNVNEVIEAESGIITNSEAEIASVIDNSSNSYVTNGDIYFRFVVKEKGNYRLKARTIAKDNYSNSFYVKLGRNEKKIWHLAAFSEKWEWRYCPIIWNLKPGKYVISIYKREPTPIDQLILEKVKYGRKKLYQ